jgi:hypothetical protein
VTDALQRLPRAELAALAREYLLAGHMIDRAGMPYVIKEFGLPAMRDVAIEEWTSASPVYTRRIRRALAFEGDDVATIFKGMQFDIGAPHQFMDFRFAVHDATHGEFSLASCGALMDVEPLGEEFVVTMCHHIEDPTFDATASATNPRARMRPVHRPPRIPAGRMPHCNWLVEIDPHAEPLTEPEGARWLATSRAANASLATPATDPEPGDGDHDYAGAFDAGVAFERFSHPTLVRLLDEIALQGHLLARAFMRSIERRSDRATAMRLGAHQLTGVAGLTASRLARFLGTAGGAADVARVLDVHPALRPRAYVAASVEPSADGSVVVELAPCDGLDEGDRLTWPAVLAGDGRDAIGAIARAVDPSARVERTDPGETPVWSVTFDPTQDLPVAEEVGVASFSTGASFAFRPTSDVER